MYLILASTLRHGTVIIRRTISRVSLTKISSSLNPKVRYCTGGAIIHLLVAPQRWLHPNCILAQGIHRIPYIQLSVETGLHDSFVLDEAVPPDQYHATGGAENKSYDGVLCMYLEKSYYH